MPVTIRTSSNYDNESKFFLILINFYIKIFFLEICLANKNTNFI